MQVRSRDGSEIHYEVTGSGDTALVFAHGWLGSTRWWDAQRDAFAATHRVVALDLAGHGASSQARTTWTAAAYAADILAVVEAVAARRVVLIGHSMSGVYATLAAPEVPGLAAVILVDTLKNIDAIPTAAQTASLFEAYRGDFAGAVRGPLSQMLFTPSTPRPVIERLQREFLAVSGERAAALLEPLYACDVRDAARRVIVPVRGIGGTKNPDGLAVNRRYFADYAYVELPGCGHYPMLEQPDAFADALRTQLVAHDGVS